MDDDPKIWLKPENLKFVAPLLGVCFAVLFDLGVFSVFGRGWFLLFSLSDHILFALTAMPFAIVAVLSFYYFMAVPWAINKFGPKLFFGRYHGSHPSEPTRPRLWVAVLVMIFAVTTLAAQIYFFEWKLLLAGVATTIVTVLLYYFKDYISSLAAVILLNPLAAMLISTTLAFLAGVGYAHVLTRGDRYPYTMKEKNGAVMKGILLVSGERGVLFLDKESKSSEFRRWDGIESLKREP